MKNVIVFFVLIILSAIAFAQQKGFKISGYVKDSTTGELLPAASINIKEVKKGTISNGDGYFSIELPAGRYTIEISYLGYKAITKHVNLNSNINIDFSMPEETEKVEEVEVKDVKVNENVESTKMSTIKLDVEQIKKLPALFGEVDVIKNIQMMPGVQVAGEGNTGLYVRGGSTDQNLVLLDEATVFTPSHMVGLLSIFSSDPLKSAELYKGGIPAQYGGRLSSLLDVRTREGNYSKIKGSGGIGVLAARGALEGPIIKDKCSFLIAARRTWADKFLKFSHDPEVKQTQLYFYDFNAKITYKISNKTKLFLSGYYGKDVFDFRNMFGISWTNTAVTLRLEHAYSEKFLSATTATFSNFGCRLFVNLPDQAVVVRSSVTETTLKQDFTYFAGTKNELSFGGSVSYTSFDPGKLTPGNDSSIFRSFSLDNYHSLSEGIYIGNKQKLSKRVAIDYGLRYSIFSDVGGTEYRYLNNNASEGIITDTAHYKALQAIKTYSNPEPRLSGRYLVNESSSIKASYNRMVQYVNLMSNSTSPLPFNIWAPSSPYIKPQKADQVALGYFRNFKKNMFETSIETYYKNMYNVVDFKDNAQILLNPHIETEVRQGKSWSYGVEAFIRKTQGKVTGWISYTWSKTQRQIAGVNNGNVYYANYDRRNNLNVVFAYDYNKRINFSANFIYGSGRPMTLPAGKYGIDNYITGSYYTQRNNYRMPAYDRLDVSLTIKLGILRENATWEHSINFSVYNVYDRKNPFSIYIAQNSNGQEQARMIYLFPVLPSCTYNFKF